MKQLKIKKKIHKAKWYQKILFWKLYQTFEIEVPESWGEVKHSDFLHLFASTLIHDEGERGLACVRAILPSAIRDEVHLMSAVSLYRAYSFMSFCEPRQVGDDSQWLREDFKLLNNPVCQSFAMGRISLSLPGKDLEHISCRNFRDAVTAYQKIQSGYKENAWKVVQAVCNTNFTAKELAKGLRYPIPSLIVRYFMDALESIRYSILAISPTFFGKSGEGDSGGIDFGWDGVFLEVAKDGVFGTYEQVLESKFHDVMIYSIKKYEDALAQQRELEKVNKDV